MAGLWGEERNWKGEQKGTGIKKRASGKDGKGKESEREK